MAGPMGMRPGGSMPMGQQQGLRASWELLQERPFKWLLISNTAFFLAMGGQMIPRSVIAYEMTGSATKLAFISIAVALPMLIFSPLGGALADRMERRRLIILGQAAIVVSECIILGLYVTELLEFWHLAVGAMFMGSIFPFSMPARQAITVNVVGVSRITRAMALNMALMNGTRILGPATAGALIPLVGIAGALAYGTALYVVALLCLFQVDKSRPPVGEPRPILQDMAEGFRYVGSEPRVLTMLVYGILPMFVLMPFQTYLVVFAQDVFGAVPLPWGEGSPEMGFGLMQAASGLGGLAATVWLAARGDTPDRRRPMMVALLGFAVFLTMFCWMPWFWVALPPLLMAGMLSSVFQTLNNSTIQVMIPDRVRGRVSSFMMMSFGLTPLGTYPMGMAIDQFGAPAAVTAAAGIMLVVAVVFSFASRSLRNLDGTVREALEAARREDEAGSPAPSLPRAAS